MALQRVLIKIFSGATMKAWVQRQHVVRNVLAKGSLDSP